MTADSRIVVSRIGGRPDRRHRYTVARIDSQGLRIAHVIDLAEARRTREEWLVGDFSFNPGQRRFFR